MHPRRPAFLPGHYYHIYNRGAHKAPIFQEEENYLFVLRKTKAFCASLSLAPIAYCLMPNHYHLLIRQDSNQPAGLLPQRVFNSYTKAYNKRYDRGGTLFEGPYKIVHVEEHAHLLHLCRYIHANPVKDDLASNLEEWPYSNYLEWIGHRGGSLVDEGFIRQWFGDVEEYRAFVADEMDELRIHRVEVNVAADVQEVALLVHARVPEPALEKRS